MKLQYLRAFIVLLAGLIALIINMKTGREVDMGSPFDLFDVEILQKGLEKAAEKDRELEEQRRMEERSEALKEEKESEAADVMEEEF